MSGPPVQQSTLRGQGPSLLRALGRWDLTAIGVNQVIGGAIFLIPSQLAAQVGNWGVIAFLLVGVASLFVALCFAEVGSRFEGTGGPYLYTRAAFGRFAAFEVGWMQWFTRVTSQASIANGIALALGFYWPAMMGGTGRALLLIGLVTALAFVNVRGIRQSSLVVNILTVGKLVPLGIFIVVGLFFLDRDLLSPLPPLTWGQASAGALLLIFAYGGYDVIPVPAGEASDPRRHVPFALVTTIIAVTAIMGLAHLAAAGILPDLGASTTPLADAAFAIMGGAGALLIGVGSIVSMTGNNAGQVLTGSRMLFALAEHGELPAFFGKIHPVYRTPSNAVIFTSAVALALALSGSFAMLAAVSAVARLVTYTGACASTLVLRSARFEGRVQPATFIVRGGPVIPVLAVVVSMAILAGATTPQLTGGLAALAAGAALYFVNDWRRAGSV
ncbi:MAG: APC family permease [Vicinamibacterales bacterium]